MPGLPPFERVVAEHGPTVWRVCRAMLDPADAEDAWSDTFLAALRAYPDLRAGSNVRGWLVTIAHNKAVDLLRRRQRSPRPVGAAPAEPGPPTSGTEPSAPAATALGVDADPDLRRALAALPLKQRAAVAYRYLADLSYAEVAGLLGCSQAAARRSAADGIAKLRSGFGRPDG